MGFGLGMVRIEFMDRNAPGSTKYADASNSAKSRCALYR